MAAFMDDAGSLRGAEEAPDGASAAALRRCCRAIRCAGLHGDAVGAANFLAARSDQGDDVRRQFLAPSPLLAASLRASDVGGWGRSVFVHRTSIRSAGLPLVGHPPDRRSVDGATSAPVERASSVHGAADQSRATNPEAFTIGRHISDSRWTLRAASCADSLLGTIMSAAYASFTSRECRAARTTAFRRSTVSGGVFAGRKSPIQSSIASCGYPRLGERRHIGPRAHADGRLERLLTEYVFPCCTPAVAGRGRDAIRSFADLGRRRLIEYDDGLEPLDANWPVWTKLMRLPDASAQQWVRVPDWHAVFDAAAQGIGVCLGRTPQVNDHLRARTLVAPIPDVLVSTRANYLIRSRDSDTNPKVRRFVEWLTSEAAAESRFEAAFLAGRRLVDPTTRT